MDNKKIQINLTETYCHKDCVDKIKSYMDVSFIDYLNKDKIFYSYSELWGWIFLKKAISNRDWAGIKIYLKLK